MDNDISLWQTQTNRQIHVGRDGEKDKGKEKNRTMDEKTRERKPFTSQIEPRI